LATEDAFILMHVKKVGRTVLSDHGILMIHS
jgi:hypothetical protein